MSVLSKNELRNRLSIVLPNSRQLNAERVKKQRVNTKTIYDLDRDNLRHDSFERRMLIYSTLMNEKIYKAICDELTVNIGGYITDAINPADYDYIMTCGPHIMMQVLADKVKGTAAQLYVSMENRMGCGVGACLVCSCKTTGGNKKVCKDGPVFKAEEVFGNV